MGIGVTLLGTFALADGDGVAIRLDGPRSRAIFAILVLNEGRPVGREAVATMLWPECAAANARGNLRQALARLRRALGRHADALRDDGQDLAIDTSLVHSDVAAFRRAARSHLLSDLTRAAALYRGPLWGGTGIDAPPFDEWLAAQGAALADVARSVMLTVVDRQARIGAKADALATARHLLRLDPLDEEAFRRLLELLATTEGRAAVVTAYATFAMRLRSELGVEPQPETRAIYTVLVSGNGRPGPAITVPKTHRLVGYDLLLNRLSAWHEYTPASNGRIISVLEEAIAFDSSSAAAFAQLSLCQAIAWHYGWDGRAELLDHALHLADTSVRLDPELPRAHAVRGIVLLFGRRFDEAFKCFERAAGLDPASSLIAVYRGEALSQAGMAKEAMHSTLEAIARHDNPPGWYRWRLAFDLYGLGRYDAAVAELRRMPHLGEARRMLAASLAQLGRIDEARHEARRFLHGNPTFSIGRWADLQPYLRRLDREHAVDGFRRAGLPL